MKRMICRITSIILVTILLCSMIPFTVSAATTKRIPVVTVVGIDAPVEGGYGDYTVSLGHTTYELVDVNDDEHINGIRWIDEDGNIMVPEVDRFRAGVKYTVAIHLIAKYSYVFEPVSCTVDGEDVSWIADSRIIQLTKTFEATEDSSEINTITFDYGFDGIKEYTFCNNGETTPYPDYYENGDLVLFDWYNDREFKNKYDFEAPVYENKTIYARYVDPADIVSVYMYTTDNDFPYSIEEAVIGDTIKVMNPEVEGMFFTEWYGDPDRVWQYDFTVPIEGDVHLYARLISYDDVATVYTYMPDEYFYTNVYEIEKGRTINFPDPEVEGMYFDGWFLDRELTKRFYKSQPITEDITLFAKLVPFNEMNTVSVYIEDDTIPAYTTLIEDGYCYLITSQPSVEGKVFFGWFTDPERLTPYNSLQPITEDVSIYAKLVDNEDLCYVSVCIDGDKPISKGYVEKGTTYSRPDPSKEGYTFFGWYCEPERINKFDFSQPITEDVTIYAKFVADEDICYVNIYLEGDEPIASGMVEKGTTYSIEDPARENMVFFGWYCEPERINKFDFSQPITEDTSIYAKFVADEDICYVNIYLDGDEPIASGMVEKGTIYSIESPAREDMMFFGWYCEPERINKFDFSQPITEDVSIYAKFVAFRDLLVVSVYHSDDYMPFSTHLVEMGTTFSLDDLKKDGMIFDGWYCEPERINKFDLSQPITSNISLYAKFVPIPILGDANGDGVVNITDVTAIQKHIAEIETLDSEGVLVSDIDKDGSVNIIDATIIQKHLAGIDTGYPIG